MVVANEEPDNVLHKKVLDYPYRIRQIEKNPDIVKDIADPEEVFRNIENHIEYTKKISDYINLVEKRKEEKEFNKLVETRSGIMEKALLDEGIPLNLVYEIKLQSLQDKYLRDIKMRSSGVIPWFMYVEQIALDETKKVEDYSSFDVQKVMDKAIEVYHKEDLLNLFD